MSDLTDEEMAAEYDRAREYDKPPGERTWTPRTCARCGAPAGFRAAALCDPCAMTIARGAREDDK